MKKYLSLISFLILSFVGFGQTLPGFPSGLQVQGLGAPTNTVWTKNIHSASAGFAWYGTFADTTEANTNTFFKQIAGMTIRTGNTLWIRNTDKTQWLSFGAGTTYVDTTQTVRLSGNGSLADPLVAHVQISQQAGNALDTLPDGIFVQSSIQNGLRSGGFIIWEQNLDYTVTTANYAINNVPYTSPETEITLSAADPTNDRIDLVVVNSSGVVDVIEGTPSGDPQQPSYDPTTEVPLSFILVTAASTEPTYCRDSIYYLNNGNTWTAASGTARIVANSTSNPYSPTEDVEGTLARNNDQIRFTKSTSVTLSTYSVLALKIRSKAAWAATSRIVLRFYSNLTPLGIEVAIGNGTFGFNSSNAATYQTIVIPLANFGSVTSPNNILFTVSATGSNTIGFYIDNIELLGCDATPIPQTGNFWQVGGNRQNTTLVGGTIDNFPVQLKTNNNISLQLSADATTTWLRGTNPKLSFFLGTGANSDYYWQRTGTTMLTNTAGDYINRFQGTTIYSFIAASSHIWNNSSGTFNMQLNATGNLLLGTNANNATTILNVSSTTKASHPFPTMTTVQKNAIVAPQEGDLVYDDDLDAYYYYDAGWLPFGGTNVTASNGLSLSGGTDVQIGGSALTANRSILTSAFSLTIVSSHASNTLAVTNSANSSSAIIGTASGASGAGVVGLSDSGAGGSFQSTSDRAIISSSPISNRFTTFEATTNTVITLLDINRSVSGGSGADGVGGGLSFNIESSSGSSRLANQMVSKWTTANDATRTSEFSITGVNSATTGTILTIAGNGAMTLGAAYQGLGAGYLAVSNTGQVTWSAGGGGGGGDALTANPLSQFAATTSAQLAGVISDETGTGLLVFGTSPTLTTPILGTPTSVTLTNATGLPVATGISGLGTGVATALAINTGSAGAIVLFNGNVGTPSSGTISTGVTLGDVTMNVTGTDATGDIYYRDAGGLLARLAIGTSGQVLRTSAGGLPEWFTTAGSGTVTSVTLTQPSAGITITSSGVAITGSGTRTFALANDLAAVEGLATTGIVRRTGTDTWTAGTLVSLTTEVTGTLPVANGGTGQTSYTNGQLLIGNTSGNTLTKATLTGTSNQINVTNGAGSIILSMAFNPTVQALADAATITWNVTNGGNAQVTLGSTGRTLSITNPIAGYTYTIEITQGSGGSKTITTWPTGTRWTGGTTPTLSTTAGQRDVVSLYYNGSNYYGTFLPNMN